MGESDSFVDRVISLDFPEALFAIYSFFLVVGFAIWMLRLSRLYRLPRERRRDVLGNPLGLYWFLVTGRELRARAKDDFGQRLSQLLTQFSETSNELTALQGELQETLRLGGRQLAEKERAVEQLENKEQTIAERIKALEKQTPEVAKIFGELVDERLSRGEGTALRQQLGVNFFFLALGVGGSLAVSNIL